MKLVKGFKGIQDKVLKGEFSPIYLLMGESDFFIDELSDFLSANILSEELRAFDFTVLYGNTAKTEDVTDACQKFPVIAPIQFVLVKEAQGLTNLDRLESYAKQPNPQTVLVLCYKHKNLDKRTGLYKTISKNGTIFESPKIYDNQIPAFIVEIAAKYELKISAKASNLLAEHLGADLSRINTEIDKISIILPKGEGITESIIEKYVGISKEYNAIEFQNALATRNAKKAYKIASYFADSKTSPLAVLPLVYNFFIKLILLHTAEDKSSAGLASAMGVNPFFIRDYQSAAELYDLRKCTKAISVLREMDLKSKGLNSGNMGDREIFKEIIFKILNL